MALAKLYYNVDARHMPCCAAVRDGRTHEDDARTIEHKQPHGVVCLCGAARAVAPSRAGQRRVVYIYI
jgi:hypothetical protein